VITRGCWIIRLPNPSDVEGGNAATAMTTGLSEKLGTVVSRVDRVLSEQVPLLDVAE
jgi:hypothetical protein